MKVIVGDRQSGKTTKLAGYVMAKPDRCLVVHNKRLAVQLNHQYKDTHFYAISWTEFTRPNDIPSRVEFVIDNIDLCLGRNVVMISATGEVEDSKCNFETADHLYSTILTMGIKNFNKEFPSWKLSNDR